MDDTEFEAVYRSVLDVIWDKVMRDNGYADAASVDRAVDALMRFEG